VTLGAYVLLDLRFHERLGEHAHALLQEAGVVLDHRLAQQLRESYPQFVGHRDGASFSVDWSLPIGTTRWPSSSTASTLTHFSGLYPMHDELPLNGVLGNSKTQRRKKEA
jgi:hypothetical protein